jgi:hypothetical protein
MKLSPPSPLYSGENSPEPEECTNAIPNELPDTDENGRAQMKMGEPR